MNNKQISGRQMQYVIIMFLLGSALIVGGTSKAKQDSWISILIAFIMVLPMIFVYDTILRKYPGDNIFDILIKVFGRITGKIICLLFVWFTIHLGSLVLDTFSQFIHLVNLPETPKVITTTAIILLSIWIVHSGVESVGRVAKSTFPILASSVLLTILTSLKDMNFNNIKPVLSTDWKALLNSSFAVFSLPLCELSIIMALFSYVTPKERPKKIYIKGLSIAVLFLVMANLRNLFVLGVPSENHFYFPSYQAVSITSIGDFFTRFEVLIGANLLLACFIKVCVCLFASSIGLAKVFNIKEYQTMVAPCGLMMILLSSIAFDNTKEMFKFMDIFKIYTIPFEVLLPLIVLLAVQIKTRKKKQSAPPKLENIGSLD